MLKTFGKMVPSAFGVVLAARRTAPMCTVTVIPWMERPGSPAGWRLACNRDERRTRAVGLPPQRHRCGALESLWPVDPEAGGTWVGVNEAGLALALLNLYVPGDSRSPATANAAESRALRSRGLIIPELLACRDLESAVNAACALPAAEFAAFRLVLTQGGQFADLTGGSNQQAEVTYQPLRAPLLCTSSGLGDQLVDPPRRKLFESLFPAHGDWRGSQDAFQRHSWPVRPELSVFMTRADAWTVSLTTIEFQPGRIAMRYLTRDDQGFSLPGTELAASGPAIGEHIFAEKGPSRGA